MGKITKALATAHDYTTDPVFDGVATVGKVAKNTTLTGLKKFRSGLSNVSTSFKEEHNKVEQVRSAKRQMKAQMAEQVAKVEEVIDAEIVKPVAAKPAKAKVTPTTAK